MMTFTEWWIEYVQSPQLSSSDMINAEAAWNAAIFAERLRSVECAKDVATALRTTATAALQLGDNGTALQNLVKSDGALLAAIAINKGEA